MTGFWGEPKTDKPILVHEFGGVVRLGANPMGPIDDAVEIVRLDTAAGHALAVMIHYACHGTSLGGRNSKISGEWMGRMQEFVEKQFPGLGAIYLQGAAGDPQVPMSNLPVNPPSVRLTPARRGNLIKEIEP